MTSRVQYLLSFVLGGYVTLCVNRFDKIRNEYFGNLWGGLENMNICAYNILNIRKDKREIKWKDKMIRYTRLIMRLTFQGARGEDNLQVLYDDGLMSANEMSWLAAALPGTRPLMPISWMWQLFSCMENAGYKIPTETRILVQNAVGQARGGVGATLGILGCPLPFYYVHIIHWTVQV